MKRVGLLALSLALSLAATLGAQEPAARPGAAPASDSIGLWDGLGGHHHAITTLSALSQRYFDQGLRFVYRVRSFRRDPELPSRAALRSGVRDVRLG
jgi:hypothetical protein